MKRIILILFILLIAACTQQVSLNETNETVITEINETIESIEENAAAQNITLAKKNVITETVNGTEYVIEIIDITETQDACLIEVNGELIVVDLGETRKINGLRIFVADIIAFRTYLEDKDVCQLVIA